MQSIEQIQADREQRDKEALEQFRQMAEEIIRKAYQKAFDDAMDECGQSGENVRGLRSLLRDGK